MRFKGLKVGDVVWVVDQERRYGNKREQRQCKVVKVGKKYGYVSTLGYGQPQAFSLATGASHHGDDNARANGFGFDVYQSREQYEEHERHNAEHLRLLLRLGMSKFDAWRMQLDPACVADLHRVLDQHGVDPKLGEKS